MRKEVNTPRELNIAKIILVLLLVLLGYLSMSFYPSWTWHIRHLKAEAKIIHIDQRNNVVTFSYLNQTSFKEVKLARRLKSKKELAKFRVDATYPITYSYYTPRFVRFDLFDKHPQITLSILAVLIVCIALDLYLGVVLNKISLKILTGVKSE